MASLKFAIRLLFQAKKDQLSLRFGINIVLDSDKCIKCGIYSFSQVIHSHKILTGKNNDIIVVSFEAIFNPLFLSAFDDLFLYRLHHKI